MGIKLDEASPSNRFKVLFTQISNTKIVEQIPISVKPIDTLSSLSKSSGRLNSISNVCEGGHTFYKQFKKIAKTVHFFLLVRQIPT